MKTVAVPVAVVAAVVNCTSRHLPVPFGFNTPAQEELRIPFPAPLSRGWLFWLLWVTPQAILVELLLLIGICRYLEKIQQNSTTATSIRRLFKVSCERQHFTVLLLDCLLLVSLNPHQDNTSSSAKFNTALQQDLQNQIWILLS